MRPDSGTGHDSLATLQRAQESLLGCQDLRGAGMGLGTALATREEKVTRARAHG